MNLYTAVAIPVQIQRRIAELQAQREELDKIHQTLDAKVTTKRVTRTCMECERVLRYLKMSKFRCSQTHCFLRVILF